MVRATKSVPFFYSLPRLINGSDSSAHPHQNVLRNPFPLTWWCHLNHYIVLKTQEREQQNDFIHLPMTNNNNIQNANQTVKLLIIPVLYI